MTAQELEARLSAASDEADVLERLAAVEVEETRMGWERAASPAQVVARPVATLAVEQLRPTAARAACAWLAPGGGVLVADDLQADPPGSRVVAMLPGLVLGTLPRLLALGPRPQPPTGPRLTLPRALLDALLDLPGDADGGPAGADGQAAEVRALVRAPRTHWRVVVTWSAGERACEVVDAPSLGVWTVTPAGLDPERELVLLRPATTTDVWRRLTALLPNDDELDG